MNDTCCSLFRILAKNDIEYAILDVSDSIINILCKAEKKKQVKQALGSDGWKRIKDTSNDVYLYGMDHFLYFENNGMKTVICFQIACRSTLNGEWVPLDRKINTYAMSLIESRDGLSYLCPEDELCYLLAKCVFTKKKFSETDTTRIKNCFGRVSIEKLMPKLEGVFFRFSGKMMDMIRQGDFNNIISSLWQFAEY